jgi:23S rRNA (uracil1939-C5)-methyltransferase
MPEPLPAPGDHATLTIDSLAFGGDGVGRHKGLAIFVPGVCPGETVEIVITEVKSSFARAELLSVTAAAPERTAPFCPVYGRCGGCQLQHLAYPAQVAAKTGFVRDALARLAKMPDVPVAEAIASPLPIGYRNKIELEVTIDAEARLALAYHGAAPDERVVIDDCPLALPELNILVDTVREWLNQTGWPAYDAGSSQGLVRGVGLRYSASQREATLLLTSGRRDLPDKKPWLDRLRAGEPRLVGIRHRARTRASQSPHGRPVSERLGRPLRVLLPGGLSLRVTPEAFFQVNEWQLPALLEQVRLALDPQPGDHLVDAYAGVGTFGLALAGAVGRVTLIEVEPEAVRDAEANVAFNKLANVVLAAGQVEQRLAALGREARVDKLILDPPRQGCSEAVVRVAAGLRASRMAYVSCDPATLARDLARFAAHGYRTIGVQPLDLFPQTYHVESVATLLALA